MSKQRKTPPTLPGNDGSWYLELLGIGNGQRSDGDATGDGATPATTTAELVTEIWQAAGVPDPLDGWAPDELDKTVRSRRTFRWTVVTVAAVILTAAAVAVWWVPRMAERRIADRIDAAAEAVGALRAELPAVQSALAVATSPLATGDDLIAAAPILARVAEAADALTRQGVEPLPDPPPIVGSADLDALAAVQERFSFMGAEGSAIARRLGTVIDYRLGAAAVVDLPELPTSTGVSGLNALSAQLAAALADSVTIVRALPADAALSEHRDRLDALLERFGTWQVEYVDALRREDAAIAAGLIDELDTMRRELDSALVPALAEVRTDIDTGILELASQLDTTLQRLPR